MLYNKHDIITKYLNFTFQGLVSVFLSMTVLMCIIITDGIITNRKDKSLKCYSNCTVIVIDPTCVFAVPFFKGAANIMQWTSQSIH